MNIIESDLQFRSNISYGNKPDSIVEHHAEAKSCTIEEIHQWHLDNGWAGCGYHFFVRKDGSIYRGRPEDAIGSHCPGMNNHSIGICAEGDYMTETMPASQKQSLIELGIYIKNKYGIKNVYGHKECFQTSCPGTNYPLQDIKDSILSGQSVQSNNNYDFVRSVQHDLQRVSCLATGEVNATGVLDVKTKAAIKQFRYVVGLPDSENIDSQLTDALNVVIKMPTIGAGWIANIVATRFIQWFIGITPKSGVFDPNTVQKVKEWQKKEGIWGNPDGVIRQKDWSKILK
ncbi:N-acetylmuramoyl-L-alanine amidase [Clostridium sp. OS1-26]|uniref:peptidoglycan recognition protein family protein n=1 Tax=Clostridium sp. OS1-26 TaxID=3070681 RepID=UPI0027DF97B7|nr:N-acetylmuramoyl-L-alanine amidase [Clostridium sp. OS1-26]WML33232.1 N-acetylmuramoyl-L-alanine amidase [Clostridium sp. OS1-26]